VGVTRLIQEKHVQVPRHLASPYNTLFSTMAQWRSLIIRGRQRLNRIAEINVKSNAKALTYSVIVPPHEGVEAQANVKR
jgi:hypothetical protein